jgi:hypothetical protein
MAKKHNNAGRSRNGPTYVMLHHWVMRTPAWRSLSVYARCLYIEMRGRYNGSNNGDISFSYREAEELLGVSNKPIPQAFRDLEDRGFIKATQRGAFSWKARFEGKGRATTWLITELPQDYPERVIGASSDFKNWVAPDPNEKKKRHAESGSYARSKRAIPDDTARSKRANGTPRAGHSDENAMQHGTPKAGTINIPYTPTALGQVSSAVLNSPLMKKAREEVRRQSRKNGAAK